jgi:hypothetical protein
MNQHMVLYKVSLYMYCYPFRFWFGYAIPFIMSNDSLLTPNISWILTKGYYMFLNYIVLGIAVELDLYKQETFIVLCITWSFRFH